MNAQHYIVFGASGWLAHYLIPKLRMLSPQCRITAVSRSNDPAFIGADIQCLKSKEALPAILSRVEEGVVINLSRGESEKDFQAHQAIISIQNSRKQRYLYASSFNALDAEVSTPHHESSRPAANSDYGRFKGRCENAMMENCSRPLLVRFAAIHGWAPNRMARTQEFLARLRNNEEVRVDLGILQNRTFVGDLAEQLAMLCMEDSLDGVFHLGTRDFSEEVDFLKKLAVAFGYDAAQVKVEKTTECNAVMLVDNLKKAFPNYSIPSEADTLRRVAAQAELMTFRRI